ncbi:MAG: His/Gly/Thr/Pro-type tRNA ligase C-terminal domain-containing protein, partial [Patescibacteria group bacterium]
QKKPLVMGCYGIGLQRLMATIVEIYHDKFGIIWPKSVAPFDLHLLGLDLDNEEVAKLAKEVYQKLIKMGLDVLYDDRLESAGIKLKDADLIGIPVRLVVSQKTGKKIEYKERKSRDIELLTFRQILNKLKII